MPSSDSYDLREQVAGLRSDVRHIQGDVTDLKTELRATNQRIDSISDSHVKRIDSVNESLGRRIDSVNESLGKKIDSINESLRKDIDSFRQSLSAAKIWALVLGGSAYGSLLLVMAKGFKWL